MRSKRLNIESKVKYADGITVRIFQMKSVKESFCLMNQQITAFSRQNFIISGEAGKPTSP